LSSRPGRSGKPDRRRHGRSADSDSQVDHAEVRQIENAEHVPVNAPRLGRRLTVAGIDPAVLVQVARRVVGELVDVLVAVAMAEAYGVNI